MKKLLSKERGRISPKPYPQYSGCGGRLGNYGLSLSAIRAVFWEFAELSCRTAIPICSNLQLIRGALEKGKGIIDIITPPVAAHIMN